MEKPNMTSRSTLGKTLRGFAIILFALTVTFQLMGGVGSSCVAFAAENYDSMAGIVPYKWLYQILVVVTTAIALFGVRTVVALARSETWSYRAALGVLVGGALVAGIQMTASQMLRGASAPNNVRFYLTAFTLLVFLLLRVPGVWEQVRLTEKGKNGLPGAAVRAAIVLCALVVLTAPLWVAPSHMIGGINYASYWQTQFASGGVLSISLGLLAGSALWFSFERSQKYLRAITDTRYL
jgi:hypothetical protein